VVSSEPVSTQQSNDPIASASMNRDAPTLDGP
jgi:hypothetical protein